MTLPKIFTALTIFFFFYLMRTYIIPVDINIKIILLEDFIFKLTVWKDLLIGFFSAIFRLLVLGFWEEMLDSPGKLPMGPYGNSDLSNSYVLTMDNGKNHEQGSNAKQESNSELASENPDAWYDNISEEVKKQVGIDILADGIRGDTKTLNKSILAWAKLLEGYNDVSLDKIKLTPETEDLLIDLLKNQSRALTHCMANRIDWVECRTTNVLEKNNTKVKDINLKLIEIQDYYFARVKGLSKIESKAAQVREFYATMNQYRNSVYKELNKAESIILEDIRTSSLYKNTELKKVLNVEFTNAKKEFNTQDSYLKSKIGQILNAKKQ